MSWILVLAVISLGTAEVLYRLTHRPAVTIMLSGVVTTMLGFVSSCVVTGHAEKFALIALPIVAAYSLFPATILVLMRQMFCWWKPR